MNDQDHRRAEHIFASAIELVDPVQRQACLDRACAGDEQLRREVESILAADAQASGFLEKPPTPLPEATTVMGPASPLAEKSGDRVGRYKLLEQIGEGGFGAVWMAEQEEPVRRRVALKIIKLGMDTREVVARFEAERQALALRDHPNLARVFDGGATESGRPYFVMELVRGEPITKHCDEHRLSLDERLDLFVQVCQAVQHAHQKGVIHRDLKPSNILVAIHDDKPVPKVIDFGIAKATQQRLTEKTLFTRFNQLIGTPAYMSPEQAGLSSLDVDTRSDIYSLGVLLYELLTGRTPFSKEELFAGGYDEICRIIREKEPPKPSTRLSTMSVAERSSIAAQRKIAPEKLGRLVRGELDWVVMKALEKDRSRRYETANAFARDIERYLLNELVAARPPSQFYRFQKLIRRNKLTSAAAVAVAAALVTGLGFSTWSFYRERVARQRAVAAEQGQMRLSASEKQLRKQAENEKDQARRLLYIANMNLAQQAWEQSNIGRLRRLLNETRDYPDRHFEWYFWQKRSHPPVKRLYGHLEPVCSVSFTPDGQQLVTGSFDTSARVWDVTTGRTSHTLTGHIGPVRCLAVSPDGRRILTGDDAGRVRVWERATGLELSTFTWDEGRISSLAISPDGNRVATAGGGGTSKPRTWIWEMATGRELLMLDGQTDEISTVAFSPTGESLVGGGGDHTARVWNAATGLQMSILEGHMANVASVALSPDGQRIVTGSEDQTARVWDAGSGRQLLLLNGHSSWVTSVAVSADGRKIATGSRDQTARIWDAATGRQLRTFRHTGGVLCVAFSPDGERVVAGDYDHLAIVWESIGNEEETILKGHDNQIRSVAFSPDGQRIVTAGDGRVAIWETATRKKLLHLMYRGGQVTSGAISPDGRRIVTGSADTRAQVWKIPTGREMVAASTLSVDDIQDFRSLAAKLKQPPDTMSVYLHNRLSNTTRETLEKWSLPDPVPTQLQNALIQDLCEIIKGECIGWKSGMTIRKETNDLLVKNPQGEDLARLNCLLLEDAYPGEVSRNQLFRLVGHAGQINSVAFSPDGQRIGTGSLDGTARVWDSTTGREILILKGHTAAVWSVTFSSDNHRILTGSQDKTARIWEANTGREVLIVTGHADGILSAAFSPDGKTLVTGSRDKTARVWEASTGRELFPLTGHTLWVTAVAFSPDSRRVLTGSFDQTARLWDAVTGRELLILAGHTDGIWSVAFSLDGHRLVTGSADQTARMWEAASPDQVTTWQVDESAAQLR